jgi:hypothetical protein
MSVTYPITLPTSPGFTRVTIAPRSFVALYASPFTGQQQIYQHPAQFLTCSIEVPPMNRAEAADFVAAMLSLHGQRGTFLFGDPAWTQPRGTPGGLFPRIKSASQTGNSITTQGWATSQNQVIMPGDWLQFGSENLLARSEEFSHATWSGSTVTVTNNTYTAPDGTTTGDKLEATGVDSFIGQAVNAPTAGEYTLSVWLRSDTGTTPINIFAVSSGSGAVGKSIVLTTAFQRYSINIVVNAGATIGIQIGGASTFTTGEIIGAWGAQINRGSYAMGYQPTGTAAIPIGTPQLCMATSGASSDGSGDATLQIFPRIRTAYAANTPITVYNPVGVWRMVDDGQFLQDTDSLTRGIVINAVEAF